MKHSQLKQLIKEEISNASTIDLAGKIRTLVYSTPFWKFRDAINMVLKSHYNRKVQLDENNTLNEGKHLSKMLGAANLKFGVDGNLYFIIGSDSYSGAANLQISKKDLPKFFKMVRDAEAQVNSLPIDEVRTDSKIWNDGSALAKELEEKGIAIKAYVEGTSSGALGKTKLYVATDGMTRDEFKQAIEQNYRKTPVSTSLSSEYYYSPKHKLYFFFYREGGNRGFHSGLDKMIDYDYTLLLKRRLPKR
jgi:hypothetical protein